MENRRTEIAREHDDHELIESMAGEEPTPRFEGTAGGNLQADIATKVELDRIRDPEMHEGVNKGDEQGRQGRVRRREPDQAPPGQDALIPQSRSSWTVTSSPAARFTLLRTSFFTGSR